jgi:hypothetical protein
MAKCPNCEQEIDHVETEVIWAAEVTKYKIVTYNPEDDSLNYEDTEKDSVESKDLVEVVYSCPKCNQPISGMHWPGQLHSFLKGGKEEKAP